MFYYAYTKTELSCLLQYKTAGVFSFPVAPTVVTAPREKRRGKTADVPISREKYLYAPSLSQPLAQPQHGLFGLDPLAVKAGFLSIPLRLSEDSHLILRHESNEAPPSDCGDLAGRRALLSSAGIGTSSGTLRRR